MNRRITYLTTLTAAALAFAATGPARADEHRGEGHRDGGWRGEGHGAQWHGRIERFHEHDFRTWSGGHWERRYHDGRYGWWWLAGGFWYWYPTPVYPYPDPYAPPVVTVVPQPAPQPVLPAAPPPAQYWYYCDASGAYYPYVPTCPSGWRAVPANPAR